MFLLRKPTDEDIGDYGREQSRKSLSYAETGWTRQERHPSGYHLDRHRVELGKGADAFAAACEALQGWQMFPAEMATLFWPTVALEPGNDVIVGFQLGPLWSLNPCRIVYTMDDRLTSDASDEIRYGFAYGTLPGHIEKGEERFLVSWNQTTDSVSYEIVCFSAAQHFLACCGYPFVRYQQWRFRQLSGRAMQTAVLEARSAREPLSAHAKGESAD